MYFDTEEFKKDLKKYKNDVFVVIFSIVTIIVLYALIETRPNHNNENNPGNNFRKCKDLQGVESAR